MIGYVRQGEDNPLPFILIGLAVVTVGFFLWKGFFPDDEGRLRDKSECKRWEVRYKDNDGNEITAPTSRDPKDKEDADQMAEKLTEQSGGARDYYSKCVEWGEYKGVPDQPKEWVN